MSQISLRSKSHKPIAQNIMHHLISCKSYFIWFTGLSDSGKTTLAAALK
ncbi:adenylyl-sulfate kinase [Oceanospirillum beijerinckii]